MKIIQCVKKYASIWMTALLAVAVIMLCLPAVPASASGQGHYYFDDFESGSGDRYVVMEGENRAWRASGGLYPFVSNPVSSGKFYIGMDIQFQTTSPLQTVRLETPSSGTYLLFGSYAGRVKYSIDNSTDWQPFDGAIDAPFNTWLRFDTLLDFDEGTIDFYYNGEPWGEGTLNSAVLSQGFKGVYFPNEADEQDWRWDNLIMTDVTKTIAPVVTKINAGEQYIDVDFKVPMTTADQQMLTPQQVQIGAHDIQTELPKVTAVQKRSATMYRIRYSGTLDSTKEYYVILPSAITGLFGQTLDNNKIYFTQSGNSVINTISLVDAAGNTSGLGSASDEIAEIQIGLNAAIAQDKLDEIVLEADGQLLEPDERILDGMVYRMCFSDLIGADKECVLTISSDISGIDNMKRIFTTGAGKFEIRKLAFLDAQGNATSEYDTAGLLQAQIINTSRQQGTVYLIYCAYNADGKMTQYQAVPLSLDCNYINETLDFTVMGKDSRIKGFLLSESRSQDGGYLRSALIDSVLLEEAGD